MNDSFARSRRGASASGKRPSSDQRSAAGVSRRAPPTRSHVGQGHAPIRPYIPAAARIEQVRDVLGLVLQWEYPADATLSHWFKAHGRLGARDRHQVAEAVFDVLRHLRRYRQMAESGTGPATRRLAILGLVSQFPRSDLDAGLEDTERHWLDHVLRLDVASLSRAVRYSLPDWLDTQMNALDNPESLINALNQPAPLDIRVNPFKTDREAVLAALTQQPGAAQAKPTPTPYSPWGIRLQGRPSINRWPLFLSGDIEVQDEGSQLLAALLAPKRGEMIIDFCAGAGGKTLLIGALMRSTGRLYAFDISAARLARAKPRFARSGLSNIVPVVIQSESDARVKRLRGKAHKVLVDAPCSGLGTLRRNPDLKWRQHPDSLEHLLQTQASILKEAARCVAPGGRLVYATCSVLPIENEQQVEAFLASHPEFTLVDVADVLKDRCGNLTFSGPYMQLRPDTHGTDGFFAAVLQRSKPENSAPGPEQDID